jgi:hypothetical protein
MGQAAEKVEFNEITSEEIYEKHTGSALPVIADEPEREVGVFLSTAVFILGLASGFGFFLGLNFYLQII